jgi:hypothetical protein
MSVMTFSLKGFGRLRALAIVMLIALCAPMAAFAQEPEGGCGTQAGERRGGGEASLVLPDLGQVDVGGYNGRTLPDDSASAWRSSASCSASSSSIS